MRCAAQWPLSLAIRERESKQQGFLTVSEQQVLCVYHDACRLYWCTRQDWWRLSDWICMYADIWDAKNQTEKQDVSTSKHTKHIWHNPHLLWDAKNQPEPQDVSTPLQHSKHIWHNPPHLLLQSPLPGCRWTVLIRPSVQEMVGLLFAKLQKRLIFSHHSTTTVFTGVATMKGTLRKLRIIEGNGRLLA